MMETMRRDMTRRKKQITWPSERPSDLTQFLVGGGCSPSVVWHSQAVGALLECGFHPSADCVRPHLRVLEERLKPENAVNPENAARGKKGADPDWRLRTRHVAWALACLAEARSFDPKDGKTEEEREGVELHGRILRKARDYLIVRNEAPSDPSHWIARRDNEDFWTDFWETRDRSLLSTLYALLGLCRAQRQGFGTV
jgi:hypothetical protein